MSFDNIKLNFLDHEIYGFEYGAIEFKRIIVFEAIEGNERINSFIRDLDFYVIES